MKKILFTCAIAIFLNNAQALDRRPEEIPSKLTEIKPRAWYEERTRNWQQFLQEYPEDLGGWMQYFKASRYASGDPLELQSIVQSMEDRFPEAMETYYAKSRLNGWSEQGTEYMLKAVEKSENLDALLPELLVLSELTGDYKNRREYANRIFMSGIMYSSLLNYCYNMLMSVADQGILVLESETTTLPIFILQDVMDVRTDVMVLNLKFLENPLYRERWMNAIGVEGFEPGQSLLDILESLPARNPERLFYYGLTLPTEHLKGLEENLFVVGLASFHQRNSFDHFATLKNNIERKFLLDYLTVDFSGEPKTATGRVYQVNYILPFLLLKEFYDESGEVDLSEKWSDIILRLAEDSQIKTRVTLLMDRTEDGPRNFEVTEIDFKNLEKDMVKVKDNIYASAYEVTNRQYWNYLDYLYQRGYESLYKQSSVDLSRYDEITATLLDNYHYSPENAQSLEAKRSKANKFLQFPALDMTYEAAKGYCEWLTFQYNQQDGRKYQKVKFRLPSRKEWTMAALGYVDFQSWNFEENVVRARPYGDEKPRYFESFKIGDYENVSYPWYHSHWEKMRNSITNRHGCYLANIKTSDEIVCPSGIKGDGWEFTASVGSYFSNDMGLFDVIGNVAEMVDESGVAMGGSWNHGAEESTITSINKYETSSSDVGFRIFMEVIEE